MWSGTMPEQANTLLQRLPYLIALLELNELVSMLLYVGLNRTMSLL